VTCRKAALDANMLYFGMQANGHCFYDNDYATPPSQYSFLGVSGDSCGSKCSGETAKDSLLFCGKSWVNAIYSTGKVATYVGCFKDDHDRDIPDFVAGKGYNVARCREEAKKKNRLYFSLQAHGNCHIGNRFSSKPTYHRLPDSHCGGRCQQETAKDSIKLCGDHWTNAVYKTGSFDALCEDNTYDCHKITRTKTDHQHSVISSSATYDCNDWPYGTKGYCACHGGCTAWDFECNRPVTDQFMQKDKYRKWIRQHTCNPGENGCAPCTATAQWSCHPDVFVCQPFLSQATTTTTTTTYDCNDWPYGTKGYCACNGGCTSWDFVCNRPVTDQFMLKGKYRKWIRQHTCNRGEHGCAPCTATAQWSCHPGVFVCNPCPIDVNYDYPGADLRHIDDVESAEKCAEHCAGDAVCKSWTYGKKPMQTYTKKCFLKTSSTPAKKAWDCCDSGVVCPV